MPKEYIERTQLIAWLEEEKLKFEEEIDREPDEDELDSEDAEIFDRGYLRALDEALSIAHEVPTVNLDDYRWEWISVDERLPELNVSVLVYCSWKEEGYKSMDDVAISRRFIRIPLIGSRGHEIWYEPWEHFNRNYKITHWMPLPKPPYDVGGTKYLLSVDLASVPPEEIEMKTPKKLRAEYCGFDPHSCEVRYKCPVCNKPFGSWSVFGQNENKNGTNKYCPFCETELEGMD